MCKSATYKGWKSKHFLFFKGILPLQMTVHPHFRRQAAYLWSDYLVGMAPPDLWRAHDDLQWWRLHKRHRWFCAFGLTANVQLAAFFCLRVFKACSFVKNSGKTSTPFSALFPTTLGLLCSESLGGGVGGVTTKAWYSRTPIWSLLLLWLNRG